jgi:hypothetical protein
MEAARGLVRLEPIQCVPLNMHYLRVLVHFFRLVVRKTGVQILLGFDRYQPLAHLGRMCAFYLWHATCWKHQT